MNKRASKFLSLVLLVSLLAVLPGLVSCGGDKDKDKIDYLVFQDESFQFQLVRAIGATLSYGADIMECLSTAYRITEGDFESWYEEWHKTAERVHNIADEALDKGHKVSARQAYLRATTYYRCAEFYLHGDPDDPRILATWSASRECFRKAAQLLPNPVEVVEIPYEGTTLPGYFLQVDDSGVARPTVIVQTGFDGTGEELYFSTGVAALQRGYNCLIFEGPGQGGALREQNLHFRPDWENVVTPVVDYALTRPEIEPSRMALIGISFGGHLAPRAVCYEHRIAACVANGGVFDAFMGAMSGPESRDEVIEYIKEDPAAFDKEIMKDAESDTGLRWAIDNGMFTFGVASPAEWILKTADYTLEGIADGISCPLLVIQSEDDPNFPGQAQKLYDAVTCPKTYMLFTEEEDAQYHCQMGAKAISGQKIFDWLDETFASLP